MCPGALTGILSLILLDTSYIVLSPECHPREVSPLICLMSLLLFPIKKFLSKMKHETGQTFFLTGNSSKLRKEKASRNA